MAVLEARANVGGGDEAGPSGQLLPEGSSKTDSLAVLLTQALRRWACAWAGQRELDLPWIYLQVDLPWIHLQLDLPATRELNVDLSKSIIYAYKPLLQTYVCVH